MYLALAPKSNASYKGLGRARDWVREHGVPEPPAALRSAAYPGAKKLGRGKGYDYPHDRPAGVTEQELMPDEAVGERFLELTGQGEERELRERLERIRRARGASARLLGSQSRAMEAAVKPIPPSSSRSARSTAAAGRRADGRPEEVQSVVDDVASVQPFWAQLPLPDRARYMRRAAQAIIDDLDELARQLSREQGKPMPSRT